MEEAATEAGEAAGDFGGKSADAWKETTGAVNDAVKALADYVKGVHDATEQAVNSVVKGFETITRPTTELEKKRDKLIQQQNELNRSTKEGEKKYQELQTQIDELNESMDQYSPKGMQDGLKSQIAFMDEYIKNLEKAREMGLSNELLASLSDGSAASAEYLSRLVSNPEQAGEVDRLFQQVQETKKGFTDALTQQKLTVDETYDAMVTKAKEAIAEMNQGEAAAAAMGDTVKGLATGISSHVSEVTSAVDSVLAELDRLNNYGVSINLGSFGSISFTLDGSHESGLDWVPFNGYLAELHEGEGILSAEENRIWQRFKNGGVASQNVDYDALGATMRDNVKPGGDVYLDGRVVGSVISEQQGRNYRALQRSGWQS
jgi:chromosome segregation ATPase